MGDDGWRTWRREPAASLRARRGALAELARLDPETDFHRIVQLVVGSVFSDPLFNSALFTVAYWRQAAVPTVARILDRRGSGDTITATRKRTDDTMAFFGFIYRDGWQGPEAGATIDRLAAIHEQFPAIRANDYRYTLASLCFEPVRIPEILGVPGLTESEARAFFLFWRNVGRRWGIEVPEGQTEFRTWMEGWERREYAFTPEAARLAQAGEATSSAGTSRLLSRRWAGGSCVRWQTNRCSMPSASPPPSRRCAGSPTCSHGGTSPGAGSFPDHEVTG